MPSPSTQCRATGPLTVDWYKLTGKGKKIDVIRRSIRKTVPFNLLDLCTNCWILMGYWRPPNQGKNAYWRWPLSRRLQCQCKRQTLNYAHTVLSPWENLVSLLFWDVTRRRLVVTYRRFGTVSVPSSRAQQSKNVTQLYAKRIIWSVSGPCSLVFY